MKTKEEIKAIYGTESYYAYKEGYEDGYIESINSLRNQAAIAAMQGTITILGSGDGSAYNAVVVEGYTGKEKTYPKEIAQFAVACADAIVEELKKK